MSPESARPVTAGTVDAGVPPVAQLRAPRPDRRRLALGERLDHAERVVAGTTGRAELAHRLVHGATASGRRSDWSGRASSLPVPQPAPHRGRAQRVEQHGLADAAQPGEHHRALGAPAGHPLEHDVERVELLVAAGELGRALAGAGGVGVPDRVHDRRLYVSLALTAYIRIQP